VVRLGGFKRSPLSAATYSCWTTAAGEGSAAAEVRRLDAAAVRTPSAKERAWSWSRITPPPPLRQLEAAGSDSSSR